MKVFVLDKVKKPLMPCTAARARKMLNAGRAVVVKRHPFTIRLKDRRAINSQFQPVHLKYDPGSKVTGIAIIREDIKTDTGEVLHLAELHHRKFIDGYDEYGQPKTIMVKRAQRRRRRRSANLRYRRPPKHEWFRKGKGMPVPKKKRKKTSWLPPTLQARVDNIKSWTDKYQKLVPISAISVETVCFDTQKINNPEISGVEYQQGTLFEYEVKEYLLEKWGRKCAYCGSENVPLEMEHIYPKSRGGTNRVSNLTISCVDCNRKKGNRPIEIFLKSKPDLFKRIKVQAKAPLKDTAAANTTRWGVYNMLNSNGLYVEMSTGGQTKYNRTLRNLPKTHAYDALCVGKSTPTKLIGVNHPVLRIVAVRRGKYQRMNSDSYGFPKGVHKKGHPPKWRKPDGSLVGHTPRKKMVNGIKSNDYVKVIFPKGCRSKHAGTTHQGYVTVRFGGNFYIKIDGGRIDGSPKYFTLIDRSAGYIFEIVPVIKI